MAEVVGVVGDVRSRELERANDVEFYRPSPQRSLSFFNLIVRTSMNPETAAPMVRAALDKIDKEIPILQPNTLDTIITQSLGQRRLTMGLAWRVCGNCIVARSRRNLRRCRLHGGTTHRRNRGANGTRRSGQRRFASCRQAGDEPGFNRIRSRSRCNFRNRPIPHRTALPDLAQ